MIEVKGLCFGYIKKPLCLVDVSFSVKNGETLLVCGGECSGKTSLLRILAGLEEQYFGKILYDGKDATELKGKRDISYLPANPVLFENKSVLYNLEYLYKVEGTKPLSEEKLKQIFDKFGLNFDLKTKIKKLSNADKKIFAMLRSFIKNSSIILIDDQFEGESEENILRIKNAILILKHGKNTPKTLILAANSNNGLIDADNYLYLSFSKSYSLKDLHSPIDLYIYDYSDSISKKYILKNEGSYYLYNFAFSPVLKKKDKPQIIYNDKVKLSDDFIPELKKVCLEKDEEIFVSLASFDKIDLEKIGDTEINKMLKNGTLHLFESDSREKII